jgi:TM2 domain-containing membrane protein YozV
MEAQKVDMFLMANGKYFAPNNTLLVRDKLLALDDSRWPVVQTLQFKSPTTLLIVSLLCGVFGVDRFMVGDVGLGIAKLLTCGGAGVWTIIDWFLIQGVAREKNFSRFQSSVS